MPFHLIAPSCLRYGYSYDEPLWALENTHLIRWSLVTGNTHHHQIWEMDKGWAFHKQKINKQKKLAKIPFYRRRSNMKHSYVSHFVAPHDSFILLNLLGSVVYLLDRHFCFHLTQALANRLLLFAGLITLRADGRFRMFWNLTKHIDFHIWVSV